MSAKKGQALDGFKLFYEELTNNKPITNRIRRVRQASAATR
ncbi:MAG TPA: hypothetical protein VFW90_04255 [Candidatus Saccharimonadales bacterium]|nr:hypothetical protein [Candidatus Saccharimonadales bacterium]